ncbi:MAG: helix-turn-helix transcriptional regulator [Lachnospiraceae bacterium]|nr:helix-turn-helix transcriptional regulator [Lachnospiraceae bacterium]
MDKRDNDVGAQRLRRLRLSQKLTQEQMAEAIGVSESLYKGNESGRLPISKKTAQLIEDKFGLRADYLFLGTAPENRDIWSEILECEEAVKMKIMLRLIAYFSAQNTIDLNDEVIEKLIKDLKVE